MLDSRRIRSRKVFETKAVECAKITSNKHIQTLQFVGNICRSPDQG